MIYFADLHVHSLHSRATSRDCNLTELARWAVRKGIRVLGTGDCTHPGWREEIADKLREAEDGLLALKDECMPEDDDLPEGLRPADIRFVCNAEISSIYKVDGAVRKVHSLVFLPDGKSVEAFAHRLGKIGNIVSDGRPILGLDCRDLLEIALEVSDQSFLVPAHAWTPWFSILGSRSGFNSVEECFRDLAPHIFALETGLSSDPEMNRRVPSLDRYALISNSDTHSPKNLGREATVFEGRPGYDAIRDAIRNGIGPKPSLNGELSPLESFGDLFSADELVGAASEADYREAAPRRANGLVGTVEFFPQRGKYHFDGHRKCSARLDPEETRKLGGKCPVCGRQVTVGVMNRVLELAIRETGEGAQRESPFWPMLPLMEIISQAVGVGPQSKKVSNLYMQLLRGLGPELFILWALPLERIREVAPAIITEAIRRVRQGELLIEPGYDGEYGKVTLFAQGDRDRFAGQQSLIPMPDLQISPVRKRKESPSRNRTSCSQAEAPAAQPRKLPVLNAQQARALSELDRAVVVQAGPGTGKTFTLTQRIARLVQDHGQPPATITAVTFTRKAAEELRSRLIQLLGTGTAKRIWVGTFHQLGLRITDALDGTESARPERKILGDDEGIAVLRSALKSAGLKVAPGHVRPLLNQISILKQSLTQPVAARHGAELTAAYTAYQSLLDLQNSLDLDDLLAIPVRLLEEHGHLRDWFRASCSVHLLVDEFQDVNAAQFRMVRLLTHDSGRGLFVIGDSDQAIYGFRGADHRFFQDLQNLYPDVCRVELTQNYRSQANVLTAARNVLGRAETEEGRIVPHVGATAPVRLVLLPGCSLEGLFITRTIDSLVGGASFFSLDSGRAGNEKAEELGFADFAVIYRLNAVGDVIEEAFRSVGIPYQRSRKKDPKEEAEDIDPRVDAVTLMTIHAAKGLEFPVVFVAGCEEGIIPWTRSRGKAMPATDTDEERRLLYVALTRAAHYLYLTCARRRNIHGRQLRLEPSSFLQGLNEPVLEVVEPLGRGRKPGGEYSQGDLFR